MVDKIKYKDWVSYITEQFEFNEEVYENEFKNLDKFLHYQVDQYMEACDSGKEMENDFTWQRLAATAQECQLKLSKQIDRDLAFELIHLGGLIERMEWPESDEYIELLDAKLKVMQADINNPVKKNQRLGEIVRAYARGFARKTWDSDVNQIRTGEMCDLIVEELYRVDADENHKLKQILAGEGKSVLDYLPDNHLKIKEWLKGKMKIPEYATKAGRSPRK